MSWNMARHFIIKSRPYHQEPWDAWFHLYVYDTAEQLRRAARRYTEHDTPFTDTLGCFQPNFTAHIDARGKPVRSPRTGYIGVMRLTVEHCNKAIAIHESAHAAVHYVKALLLRPYGFSLGTNIDTEEALCHAAHEFSMAVMYCMGYTETLERAS